MRQHRHFFRRTTFILALILAAGGLSAGATPAAAIGQASQEAQERIQKAVAMLGGDQPDPDGALEELDRALVADVANPFAHYYRGMAYGQLQRLAEALDEFVLASELAPGYADAHVWACRIAFGLGDFETSWEQAILAAQSGVDMSQAFVELRQRGDEPSDLQDRLRAPRVVLGAIDTEAVAGRDGIMDDRTPGINTGTGVTSARGADTTTNPAAGGADAFVGPTGGTARLGEAQADLYEVRRMFGELLQRSREFAVVQQPELAEYVLFLKIDQLADNRPRELSGFVKFFQGETEVYSRPLRLRDIESKADLRTEITRYVTFMEQWLAEERQ